MATPFPDRRDKLFGRDRDLAYLLDRVQYKGITVVVGRAQMGKSWLLTETARRLTAASSHYLVGFTEASEPTDLFRQAVSDLYERWISDSTWTEQAQMMWKQQQRDLIGKSGRGAGSIFASLSKLAWKPGEAVGGLVKDVFNGMANINHDLVSGPIQLAPLQSEDTRELLASMSTITNRQLVLILDQWEKSPTLDLEAKILDLFRRHLEDWPECHIIVGTQPSLKINSVVRDLRASAPAGWVEIYQLPPMQLGDTLARDRLLQYVRGHVPVATHESDDDLLAMIAGYPGTVYKWTQSYNAWILESSDLKTLADDANNYRFREFDDLLPSLTDSERDLAMRLVLLSAVRDLSIWKPLWVAALDGLNQSTLDDLRSKEILDEIAPPSYGHPKRSEAAMQWFHKNRSAELLKISEFLIYNLAERINAATAEAVACAIALASLQIQQQLSDEASALFQIGRSFFRLEDIAPDLLQRAVNVVMRSRKLVGTAPLFAIGLCTSLNAAKEKGNLKLRDDLLLTLQRLAQAFPEYSAVRAGLAMGLLKSLNDVREEGDLERRDSLLSMLTELAESYPDDSVVRERLANGLYNTLYYVMAQGEVERRNGLLLALRRLADRYPDDTAVRGQVAKALNASLNTLYAEGYLERRDGLISALRQLAESYPEDSAVREHLAEGLLKALFNAEDDLELRHRFLSTLQLLAESYPNDFVVRDLLAKGLYTTLFCVKPGRDPGRRDGLISALRQLAESYPEDSAVRERFAMGLLKALFDAHEEGDLQCRDHLLSMLERLAASYPSDTKVSDFLARGFLNKFFSVRM